MGMAAGWLLAAAAGLTKNTKPITGNARSNLSPANARTLQHRPAMRRDARPWRPKAEAPASNSHSPDLEIQNSTVPAEFT